MTLGRSSPALCLGLHNPKLGPPVTAPSSQAQQHWVSYCTKGLARCPLGECGVSGGCCWEWLRPRKGQDLLEVRVHPQGLFPIICDIARAPNGKACAGVPVVPAERG